MLPKGRTMRAAPWCQLMPLHRFWNRGLCLQSKADLATYAALGELRETDLATLITIHR